MYTFLKIDLRYNRIAHITDVFSEFGFSGKNILCLANFRPLPNGEGHYNTLILMENNPFACDCIDFEYFRCLFAMNQAKSLSNIYCDSPESLLFMEVHRIPLVEFVCDLTTDTDCPSGCRCLYRPANATLHVDCSSPSPTNITTLPFRLPRLPKSYVKYKLVFSGNKFIRRLENRKYLVNTTIVDLSDCGLEEIDRDAWISLTSRTQLVDLRGNSLTTIPKPTNFPDKVPSVASKLSLGNNPWSCSCNDSWLADWLNATRDKLTNSDEILCALPTRLAGRSILKMTDPTAEFCFLQPDNDRQKLQTAVITTSSLAAGVVAVVAIYIIVYRLRRQLFSQWKLHPFDRDECRDEDMLYDVFLCCSSEDHEASGLRILQLLEDVGYRVCYHLRDFIAGEPIESNICMSVQRSKRTVCLITENFLQSAYCMHEFDLALHHNIAIKRSSRLIVLMALNTNPADVISGRVFSPNSTGRADDGVTPSDTTTLQQYLRRYTYIDYTAADWFDKLLYALPANGLLGRCNDRRNIDDGDDVELLRPT
jgi:hypothetical protein